MEIEAWPSGNTYRFDECEYDERTDRLYLRYGPPTAATAQFTPEGHLVNIGVPDPILCGVVLMGVTQRLETEGRITLTLGPLDLVTLGAEDVAALLTRRNGRRTNRFVRTEALRAA